MSKLQFPVEPYKISGYCFGQRIWRRLFLLAWHLGDDVEAAAGTPVRAIGDGEVVWSEVRFGSVEKKNWGGIVVIKHECQRSKVKCQGYFYSVYGHMTNLRVKIGERAIKGQVIGEVAAGNTPENGWWANAHLHFAIYIGPWREVILPGWWRPEEWRRTKFGWWKNPVSFIKQSGE